MKLRTIHLTRFLLLCFVVTLSVQLASCGAAEISSAKQYRMKRDYVSANQHLETALKSDPTNDEAWYLYVVNLYDLKRYERIAEVIDTAMLYSTSHRSELDVVKRNTWIDLYNGGVTTFNSNPESKEAQQAAIGYLEAARKLAPDQPETYEILGNIYYTAGDTLKSIETYRSELNQIDAANQQGTAMGLMLHESPQSVERAIGGAPARKQMVGLGGTDSAMVYVYPSKQAFVYFERAQKAPHDWELTGWRIGATDVIGMQPMRVSTQPYAIVANYYYTRGMADVQRNDLSAASKEFDQAVPLLMTLQQIDPADEFASQAIPDIYTRLNQTDKAKQQYEKLLAAHPSKATYVSYGTLLMKAQDFKGAIEAYQKALSLDANYAPAIYDLAAVYKNMAAVDQKAKKPEYKTELEKSTDYFEQLHAIDRSDVATLENLAENYDILGKKDKALGLISEFENLKSTDAANNPEFWEVLAKLYARANRSADSEAAYKKADQLKQH